MKSKNYKTKKIKDKIKKEKSLVFLMIKIFCKSNHKNNNLCKECIELYNYASSQIDRCRFIETKTFCSACPSHCYKKDMREKNKRGYDFFWKKNDFLSSNTCIKTFIYNFKN